MVAKVNTSPQRPSFVMETNKSENIPSHSWRKLKARPCPPFFKYSIWEMRQRSYQKYK